MYICIYIYIYICIYVYWSVFLQQIIHGFVFPISFFFKQTVDLIRRSQLYKYICIYIYIYMNKTMCIYMPMNKYTCIMYIYIHLYRHMYVEMYKHIHVYTCVYTYLHVHTYIHMYIHMCTHEHTQMRSISAEPAGLAAGPAGRDKRPGRPGWTAGWSGPARETSCCGPAKQPGG